MRKDLLLKPEVERGARDEITVLKGTTGVVSNYGKRGRGESLAHQLKFPSIRDSMENVNAIECVCVWVNVR